MSDVRKYQYMHKYPFICTQSGTRPMTKKEQKLAQSYLLDIVSNDSKEDNFPLAVLAATILLLGIFFLASIIFFVM